MNQSELSDRQRALLFLYVTQVGLPPWARSEGERAQIIVLAKLMNWTEERAEAALNANAEIGHATKDSIDPLDAVIVDG